MGCGPQHLLKAIHEPKLLSDTHEIYAEVVELKDDRPGEVSAAFDLDRIVSEKVREAVSRHEMPLVLSGNCNTSVGTLAGLGVEDLGIVWLDAHPDFETPDTTTTGFTDNMGLSIAVGHCWRAMAGDIPGHAPVSERSVVLIGTRAGTRAEEERLRNSDIAVVTHLASNRFDWLQYFEAALEQLESRVSKVYVHLDLDVLDAEKVGKANESWASSGLTADELRHAMTLLGERFRVAALGVASYDPAFDDDGSVMRAALAAIEQSIISGCR